MKIVFKLIRSSIAASIVICVLVFLVVIWLRSSGKLQFLELAAYDYYLNSHSKSFPQDSRIVLIKITEEDIQRRRCWPLTDATLARLLNILISYNPRVIGLDIYRDIPVPPGEAELTSVFSKNHKIVTIEKPSDSSSIGVQSPYVKPEYVGFSDVLMDFDDVVRRGLLFMDDGKKTYTSFSLLLSLLYLNEEGISPQPGIPNPEHMRLGKTTFIPLETNDGCYINTDVRGYQYLIDYRGTHIPFVSFSLTDVLEGKVKAEVIKNKIVMIGVSAESVKDAFISPINRFKSSGETKYGIALHANMVSQLLRSALEGNNPMTYMRESYEWAWIFLWGIISSALGLWIRSFWRLSLVGLSGFFLLVLITHFTFKSGWWLPLISPAISWFTSASLVITHVSYLENAKRRLLMQLFSKHVSEDVADKIWQQRDEFMDNGLPRPQKLTATVLFTDLKGFTSISEKMEPQHLMDWLNKYMDSMTHIINNHNGIVNKFIGDSIMAIFGVPLARTSEEEIKKDAVNAVNCAIDMEEELMRLNTKWVEQNLPKTKMRIGIYTGPLVAGSFGGTMRMEYTVIGDTVNIASRLESYSKDTAGFDSKDKPTRIIIGDATLRCLDNQFQTKMLGEIKLKGKEKKITAYSVICQSVKNNSNSRVT